MSRPLELVFLWHMHQPDYRDHSSGEFLLPWVYLHALKDYSDMAYHLEQHPQVRVTVNYVPVLLDQLEDYVQQFATGQIRDTLLRLLVRENLNDLDEPERDLVLTSCFRSNHHNMVAPYPAYKRMSELYKLLEPGGSAGFDYLSGTYFSDLLTWYHLAWCGESVRREHDLVIRLMSKHEGFSYTDRKGLFDLIGQVIAGIIPRYRKLAETGQIELSTTPHYHPLAPLLMDMNSAKEAMPEVSLPQSQCYSGGKSRVEAHVFSAIKSHEKRFGATPGGIWPAEGAVSASFLEVLAAQKCRWSASGEGVLANSLLAAGGHMPDRAHFLYRPYRVQGAASSMCCFFRDDRLSDLIGFEYSRWNGKDAALHFVTQLESIAELAPAGETPVVSVILDGENAWEYYPYNGYHFFTDLYSTLQLHSTIRTTTFCGYVDRLDSVEGSGDLAREGELHRLVAGSWVYGNFSTWIGSPDKNRAWDLLCIAKQSYDMVMASGLLNEVERRDAEKQLASCESSDWFWWFGDYNPGHAVSSFDRLYRINLMHLYRCLKLPVPASLDVSISQGGGSAETGGTMRRAS
ncbi:glycoside hydrolase family 57 protein [Candidatus Nitrotoga fabula]|uniref:Glycoside hydrolase family 57 n=1 Tax=Candidatus Nitrotoga fabula TaxID=2182327 RepID=A0A916BEK6_9PROT|nr:glycoside hydrolase family 57 protein [Candidatus Nitrotoga fabula]CAE6738742.1 Glycoside hydrolase family 57 [Candidatus Nitrotoga fabula]